MLRGICKISILSTPTLVLIRLNCFPAHPCSCDSHTFSIFSLSLSHSLPPSLYYPLASLQRFIQSAELALVQSNRLSPSLSLSLSISQNPSSLDWSIQSALSSLFPPFEATAPTVLSQLFRTIDERFQGDALQCLLDFLIPAKHILESVQQAACVSVSLKPQQSVLLYAGAFN